MKSCATWLAARILANRDSIISGSKFGPFAALQLTKRQIMRLNALGVVTAGCVLSCTLCLADETKEPPQRLTLQINGKSVEFDFGDEIKVTGNFQDPTIRVLASPTRQFAYGGLSFEYPANFIWEAEIKGKSYRAWTISGNDSTIMYFVLDSKLTPDEYAKSMQDQFGAKNTKIETISREFGNLTLQGIDAGARRLTTLRQTCHHAETNVM